jgi:hypothetical protein
LNSVLGGFQKLHQNLHRPLGGLLGFITVVLKNQRTGSDT